MIPTTLDTSDTLESPPKKKKFEKVPGVSGVSQVEGIKGTCTPSFYQYFKRQGNNELILSILYEYEELSYKEITNKSDLGYQKSKLSINRLKEKGLIETFKDKKETLARITVKGVDNLENQYQSHLDRNKPKESERIANLDIKDCLQRAKSFLQDNYVSELATNNRKGRRWLKVDFAVLSKQDLELTMAFTDKPEEVIKSMEIALGELDKEYNGFKIRLFNVIGSNTSINELKDIKNFDRFLTIEGTIRQESERFPMTVSSKYECPSCGEIISILQITDKQVAPSKCSCGRRGKFSHLSDKTIQCQKIVLQEPLGSYEENRRPEKINCILYDDLTNIQNDLITTVGNKIRFYGILKPLEQHDKRTGANLRKKGWIFQVNNLERLEDDISEIKITDEEIEGFKKQANGYTLLEETKKIFSTIYGYDYIKESLCLQLVSGGKKELSNKKVQRGTINILYVADGGIGKSDFINILESIAPKYKRVSGAGGSSGAGLTYCVDRDEFLGEWYLEGGAIVMANKGILCIDEGDKIDKETIQRLHEAMENLRLTVDKANIHTELPAQTKIFMVANPKGAQFSDSSLIGEQLPFEPTLLQRFDLIWGVRDNPNEEFDRNVARTMLHRETEYVEPKLHLKEIMKLIAYASRINPKIPNSILKKMEEDYVRLRMQYKQTGTATMSARQLEGLKRLIKSYAKWRLATEATEEDYTRAKRILEQSLRQISSDGETIDVSIIEMGMSSKHHEAKTRTLDLICQIEKEGTQEIDLDVLYSKSYLQRTDFDWSIKKLKDEQEIFESKPNKVRRL